MQSLEVPNAEAPPRGRQLRWLSCALLAAITALAAFLRVQQAGEGLWLDELHTAWTVSGGISELPHRAAMGNNSPLYFLLSWATTRVFGMSEWALRLPSLVAGTLVVPALFLITWRWTQSVIAASLAALLATMDPNFLFFSLDARPYAAVQLVALVQLAVFWQLARHPAWPLARRIDWRFRLAFIALSVLLFYLHYTTALWIAAEVLYLLIAGQIPAIRPAYRIDAWLLDVMIVALLCAPAAPHLMEIAARRDNWALAVPKPSRIDDRFHQFWLGIYALVPAAMMGGVEILCVRRRNQPRSRRFRRAAQCLLAFCCFYVPLATAFLLSVLDVARLWLPRYVIATAAMPMLIGGIVCSVSLSARVRIMIAVTTLAIAIVWVEPADQWLLDGRIVSHSEENWRDAVALINADDNARTWPVLVRSGLIEANGLIDSDDAKLREYCLLPVRSIYSLGDDRRTIPLAATMPGRIKDKDLEQVADCDGIWLITPGGEKIAAATLKQVKRTLSRGGMQPGKETANEFGGVTVMRVPLK